VDPVRLCCSRWYYPCSSPARRTGHCFSEQRFLETLTVELTEANIVIRQIKPKLLLCLIGPKYKPGMPIPGKETHKGDQKASPTKASASTEPVTASKPAVSTTVHSNTDAPGGPAKELTQEQKDLKLGHVHIMKCKAEALGKFLEEGLKDFTMPPDA